MEHKEIMTKNRLPKEVWRGKRTKKTEKEDVKKEKEKRSERRDL
jgi:hypothetical protein